VDHDLIPKDLQPKDLKTILDDLPKIIQTNPDQTILVLRRKKELMQTMQMNLLKIIIRKKSETLNPRGTLTIPIPSVVQ
jgi:hypothetical protein